MLFLSNSLLTPDFGTFFWTTLLFLVLWFVLGKFAFRPIATALKEREDSIQDSLSKAEGARNEMAKLQAQNEEILRQAQAERTEMLNEAKRIKDQILAEAKVKADEEYKRKLESAVGDIKNREQEMFTNVKNQVGNMAIEIAEKIIRRELKGNKEHEEFASRLAEEIKMQ